MKWTAALQVFLNKLAVTARPNWMARQHTTNNGNASNSFIHTFTKPRMAIAGVATLGLFGYAATNISYHVTHDESWLQVYKSGHFIGLVPNQLQVTQSMQRIADGYHVHYTTVPVHATVSKSYDWHQVASFPTQAAVITLNNQPLVYTNSVKSANNVLENVKKTLTANLTHVEQVTTSFVGHVSVAAVTVSVADIQDPTSATRYLLQSGNSGLAGRSAMPTVREVATSATNVEGDVTTTPLLGVQTTATVKKTVTVGYKVKYVKDSHLATGETKVVQAGQSGQEEQTVKETFLNGKLNNTQVISKRVVSQPKEAVVEQGTNSGIANGSWVWPTDGYIITSPFGWRAFGGGQFHPGIDIGVPIGTPIYATNDGTVISAGWNSGGYGNWVEIDNGNGITTVFGHMSKVVAKDGEVVTKGQVIGYSGETGDATGPHLHYEVRLDGTAINPMKYT